MDEEKTIDEAVDEPAIDEAVEQADEMKEFEPVAFDEVIKDEPVKETAPVLRALGDPEPADMNMIHKHLDNFLAMLCGETPIDDNVRNSTEYWLKRIATGAGDLTKKRYMHFIRLYKASPFTHFVVMVVNDVDTAYTQSKELADYIKSISVDRNTNCEFIASGGYNDGTNVMILSSMGYNVTSEKWFIAGMNLSTTGSMIHYFASNTDFNTSFPDIVDTVIPTN